MAWNLTGAEDAFLAWLDTDTPLDPSLALYIKQWIEEFVEKGPDRRDGAITHDDGERVTYRAQLTKVEITCLIDREKRVVFVRSIGRPRSNPRYT
jgi:mRNA-degrading endonuclease RelE of RelBE toxin-antitoxin system